MAAPPTTPRCPLCGIHGKPLGTEDLYRCDRCGGLFDSCPDEGGTHSTYDPAARMKRAETRREKRYGKRY